MDDTYQGAPQLAMAEILFAFATFIASVHIIACSRCSDKIPAVRSKALANLASYFEQIDSDADLQSVIDLVMVPKMVGYRL